MYLYVGAHLKSTPLINNEMCTSDNNISGSPITPLHQNQLQVRKLHLGLQKRDMLWHACGVTDAGPRDGSKEHEELSSRSLSLDGSLGQPVYSNRLTVGAQNSHNKKVSTHKAKRESK